MQLNGTEESMSMEEEGSEAENEVMKCDHSFPYWIMP